MDTQVRLKRGDTRHDGLVFCRYNKSYELWVTRERFDEIYPKKDVVPSKAQIERLTQLNPQTGLKWRSGEIHPETGRIFHTDSKRGFIFMEREAYDKAVASTKVKAAKRRESPLYKDRYREYVKGRPEAYLANKKRGATKLRERLSDPAFRAKRNAKTNETRKKRRRLDPLYQLEVACRSRVGAAFRDARIKKGGRTSELVGCSWEHLKHHIESQFKPGMGWHNRRMWHVDHRTPLASATTEDELIKLCHWTNLQPLWALENSKKGDKVSKEWGNAA